MNKPHDTWQPGKHLSMDIQPDVRDYLAQTENIDADELVELICADQMQRWQQGERVPVETYLNLHPILAGNSGVAFELIYAEFLLREHLGESPALSEYQWRFPHFADRLERQVELHHALHIDSAIDEPDSSPDITSHGMTPHATTPAVRRGPQVPGYEVLEELGRGGMGIVYKARHLELNRLVALKVLRDGALAGQEEGRRFRREAELVARMAHPNIVPIYEVGEHQGLSYLALEFVEGGSLKQKLAGAPQEPRLAAELVQTLARAVHHAHQRGVIHRDLNPANVLLANARDTPDGTNGTDGTDEKSPSDLSHQSHLSHQVVAKITDFGLAKHLASEQDHTRTGAVLGTPSYMSPEQAQGMGNQVGPATDLYGLGAILYEMLTGRPPFQAPTVLETVMQVVTVEPAWPHTLQPGVPPDLETICLKCLNKQPARRYASAEALAEDLERWLAGEPIQARRVGEMERAWLWARRKPALASALAVAVLALAIGSTASTWFGLDAGEQAREAHRQEGAALVARDQATESARHADDARKTAEQARDSAKKAEATAKMQAAEQTFRLGVQQAQAGAVDRGLFLMLNAWRQAPEDAVAFRRIVRTNLAGWSRQLPRLRQALRTQAPDGTMGSTIATGDSEGRTFLTWLGGRSIHRWDVATGRAVGSPFLLDAGNRLLDVTPDGERLALQSELGNVVVERATGKPNRAGSETLLRRKLLVPRGNPPGFASFEHLPDVAVTAPDWDDGSRRFWDLRTGKALAAQLQLRPGDSFRLTRTSDGREVALVFRPDDLEPSAVVVELARGKQHVLTGAGSPLSLVGGSNPAISHDGRVALVFSGAGASFTRLLEERSVIWWDLGTGRLRGAPWKPRLHSRRVSLREDSLEILSEGIDGRFRLFDLASGMQRGGDLPAIPWPSSFGERSGGLAGNGDMVISNPLFSGSPDGRLVFTLEPVGIARVWDTSLSHLQSTVTANPRLNGHAFQGWSDNRTAVYSPDRRRVVLTERSQPFAALLDARSGAVQGVLRQPFLEHAAFSPDGRYLATATSGIPAEANTQMVILRDAVTGRPVATPWLSPKRLHALAFSPDSKTLAAGGVGGTFILDVPTNTPRHYLPETTCICELKFHPDGRRLVSLARSGWEGVGTGQRVWDVWTGKPLGPFRANEQGAPGGETVTAWHADTGELAIFEMGQSTLSLLSPDGRTVRQGPWPTGPVRIPTFSSHGRRMAACTTDNSVQQWNTRTGRSVGRAMPHTGPVRLLRYGPQSSVLAAIGLDGSVRLWDAATGWPLGPPLLHHSLPVDLAFADEGHTLLTVTRAGTVRTWPVPRPVQGGMDGPDRFETWMQANGGVRSTGEVAATLTPEEWQTARATLAKRWPVSDAALNEPDDLVEWHRARALDAEEAGNERGELYHLNRLAALRPQEAGLQARIAQVHARVAARLPAGPTRQREWQLAWAARKRGMGWPGEDEANRLAALAATHHERWDEALWYLDRLIARRESDWRAWADRADIHGRLGDKAKRDADSRQALARGGAGESKFVLTLGDVWAREDRWREVAGVMEGVVKAGSVDLNLVQRLALAQLKAGNRLGHASLCRELLRTVPAKLSPDVAQTLAELCALSPESLNDWGPPLALAESAVRWTEEAEKKAGSEQEKQWLRSLRRTFLRTRGALLHRAGRNAKAIAVLTEAMKLAPGGQGETVEWAWLALAHAGAQKHKEAQHWLNRARQAQPKRDGNGLWDAVLVEVLLSEANTALSEAEKRVDRLSKGKGRKQSFSVLLRS